MYTTAFDPFGALTYCCSINSVGGELYDMSGDMYESSSASMLAAVQPQQIV